MANIKSKKKRIVTSEKSRMRNRAVKAALKTNIRRVKAAVGAKDSKLAYAEAVRACRDLDKACSKGVIHKNQAANRKSGVMAMIKELVNDADRKAYRKPERKMPKNNGSKKVAT
ncbi:MAG: 30S ribosomal protein S20 [Eggerthellaceae bacterium]|nr:30S ribosomal protein S20 [Eggerthellaceae bacterium]